MHRTIKYEDQRPSDLRPQDMLGINRTNFRWRTTQRLPALSLGVTSRETTKPFCVYGGDECR